MYKMKSYCLKSRKNTKKINPTVSNTSNGKTVLLSKCEYVEVKNQDYLKIKK